MSNIIFLDDLVRLDFWPAKEYFYDNLTFVFQNALGINVGSSARKNLSLNEKIELERLSWVDNYSELSIEYKAILDKIVLNIDIVIGYELSPGLMTYLDSKSIVWINFRISPLRFLDDLLIAVTSSSNEIRDKIKAIRYPEYEIKLHANKLTASYRHIERYHPKPSSGAYFVGQTSADASLISNGRFITIDLYKEQLRKDKLGDEIFYLKHPSVSHEHAESEMEVLKQIYDRVIYCDTPLYELFFSDYENQFISLSSGSIQESYYFDKIGKCLHRPVCVLYDKDDFSKDEFVNITFTNFIDYDFWSYILGYNSHIKLKNDNIKTNELRTLHNVWWGYAKVLARENEVTRELNKPILNEINNLNKRTVFFMGLKSHKPNFVINIIIGFSGGDYQWHDRKITFKKDGGIFEDDINVGEWRIINLLRREIILIWNEGYWMDCISTNNKWQSLNCKNHLGDNFIVEKIR